VHRSAKPSATATTTTRKAKPDPNRIVTLPGRPPPANALALPDGCRQGKRTPSRL
jgi:hypothetical protein